ncbi:MAG: M20/M25/M40 family metallo-hydrolase [Anaerolineaceae bacterium]|nr:M20/M25/M40 family metallo-hydrolase [Anaerolineaceae bacterium]
MPINPSVDHYLELNMDDSIRELSKYCTQPSIAAQQLGTHECAQMTRGMLEKRGFTVEVFQTAGAPIVFAERKGRSDKTLLFYNHYDVQPPEPLELWESPPFSPTIRDGKLFARGVVDDKGHLTSRLFAIDAILDVDGELPCNVKFVVEGEEEISSVNLEHFVKTHQDLLHADACVWEYGGVDFNDRPVLGLGLRGICYVELRIKTANQDVHSGLGGSIFPNAAWRMVWALATLKGPDESIRIEGFHDDILPIPERSRELMARLPDPSDEYRNRYGLKGFIKGLSGGVDLLIEEVFTPTCTICGLSSGYQGEGSKTILPCEARAKLDFRLVPNMQPEKIIHLLRAHLDQNGFQDIDIIDLGSEAPAVTDPDDPFVKVVVEAAREVYDQPMQIVPLSGGSGPNAIFMKTLHLPIVSAGVSYPGAQIHAPNENMRLDLYLKGARHIARMLTVFGAV